MCGPISGTMVTNEGHKFTHKPFEVNSNTFVFGYEDGGWFKMRSVDATGNGGENRYTNRM